MKRFITIAALVAASTAFADAKSEIPSALQDDSLVLFYDFSTGAGANKGSSSMTNSFSRVEDGQYGTLSGSGPYTTGASSFGMKANAFTVSFDVSSASLSNWTNLLSIYTNGTTYGDNNALMLQQNNAGSIMLYVGAIGGTTSYFGGASAGANATILSTSDISGSEWKTITFTSDGEKFVVYVDGKQTATASLATTSEAITGFQFGSAFGGSRALTSASFDNIAFWNKTLTAAEVASLFPTIPEPSAFGLLAGLGALAFAVSRRKRR